MNTRFHFPNPLFTGDFVNGATWDMYELSLTGDFASGDGVYTEVIYSEHQLRSALAMRWSIYGKEVLEAVHLCDQDTIAEALRVLRGMGVIDNEEAERIEKEATNIQL